MTSTFDLPDSPLELARLQDAVAVKLSSVSLTAMTDDDVLLTADVLERSHRRSDGVDARVYAEVSTRGAYRKAGVQTPGKYLTAVLRLGAGASKRRVAAALALAPMYNYSGDQLDPALPATAAAVADGDLSVDHVSEITAVIEEIPAAIPAEDKARAESEIAELSRELTPEGTREVGRRILAHLDPDGSLTDDADRARTRGFAIQPQDKRLMSKIRAQLSPSLRAKLEAILTLWAEPGMNNPDDPESPRGAAYGADAEALAAARERDTRSQSQRNHDALEAMLDHLLANGALGDSVALPAHLVVTASLEDLENRAGVAVTATGTRLPVTDLVDIAADATPWLEVFEGQSSQILHLGRGKRLASLAQRLALFGRDRGCTAPGCTTPWSRTQAHHMPDWQDGGPTDINHLGGACGGHNRSVSTTPGGWETTILTSGPFKGRVGWRPTGSNQPWKVNHSLQPEKLLPAIRATQSGSAVEKWLSCRIPAPPPGPPAPPGVDVVRNPA
ncbi:HNH endonuclease signature motif containing protein [Gordonia malaquae]|uniref:HNH endonuclease signature motif containing protein n=1 Tax=Gordonia malaquae TaxID=410332 RepID=UPI0030FF139D